MELVFRHYPVDHKNEMGHSNIWNSHPKNYCPGSRTWCFMELSFFFFLPTSWFGDSHVALVSCPVLF